MFITKYAYNVTHGFLPLYRAPALLRSMLALVSIAVVSAATRVWRNAYATSSTTLVADCCKVENSVIEKITVR